MAEPRVMPAKPSKVKAEETYRYAIRVADITSIRPADGVDKTQGKITINVPYDGDKHFPMRSISMAETEIQKLPRETNLSARIGQLNLSKTSKVRLENDLHVALQNGSISIDVPIKDKDHAKPDWLRDDRHKCDITYDYTPEPPAGLPLLLKLELFDEPLLGELWEYIGTMKDPSGQLKQRAMQRALHKNLLTIKADLTLKIPHELLGDQRPTLKRFGFKWPVIPSQHHKHVLIDDKKEPDAPRYQPERRHVEWGEVKFHPAGPKDENTALYEYKSPSLKFQIERPSALLQDQQVDKEDEQVEGELEIKLPTLLSDVILTYENKSNQSKEKIELTSTINSQLTLNIRQLFQQRFICSTLDLEFKELDLDQARVADVIATLREQRLMIANEPTISQNRCTVCGIYDEGVEVRVLVELTYESRRTKRERETTRSRGYDRFTSWGDTGSLLVHVSGIIKGHRNRHAVAKLLNGMHKSLKKRFRNARPFRNFVNG